MAGFACVQGSDATERSGRHELTRQEDPLLYIIGDRCRENTDVTG